MTVPAEEASANYVPAAAVIRRMRALSGFIGRKEYVGGLLSLGLKIGAQPSGSIETGRLEVVEEWNSQCSGEMRRYWEEHRWRRRLLGRTDAEARKPGERTGLDTPVVLAVNDGY
jgi:hypothetical protein